MQALNGTQQRNQNENLDAGPLERPAGQRTGGASDLLSATEAARRLGITVTTLYDWLGKSDVGLLEIRGQRVTVRYFQGGPLGQGRIKIEIDEIERLKEIMHV